MPENVLICRKCGNHMNDFIEEKENKYCNKYTMSSLLNLLGVIIVSLFAISFMEGLLVYRFLNPVTDTTMNLASYYETLRLLTIVIGLISIALVISFPIVLFTYARKIEKE